ncbi:serine hydrolase domain-containing protein [Telluribacter humicola]|uniref:serine hydrolase domain-containing protein n=1 Tax=Telluribacter humicola TaxID=1720261 RepID=UPI001A96F052|nr:serine hydrolase domain-containing protein [Telluribacter humicola]
MNALSQSKLDKIVTDTVAKKDIFGAAFRVATPDQSVALTSAAGNIGPDSPFYIASINKLFVAALTLRLVRDKRLSLSDPISKYLPGYLMLGLHVYQGQDYSEEITIQHLITQTSGLPCYLIDKRPNGPKVMEELLSGHDQAWTTDQVVTQVKRMKPKFRPGQKGKASYGNTNFRLLGRVLEIVTGKSLDRLLTQLFEELDLTSTFVIRPDTTREFVSVYARKNQVHLPRYFASSKYDIVSTTHDLMAFLRAFFGGYFYPKDKLPELEQWNSVFFPFRYGVGMQQFRMPWIFSPFKPIPEMVGHCGSVGTAAFYVPQKDVFITGTINQTSNPQLLFQTMIRIVNLL